MKFKKTARNFDYIEFVDEYQKTCSLQESSSVIPRVWFGISPDRAHLSQEHVRELLPYLKHFAENGDLRYESKDSKGNYFFWLIFWLLFWTVETILVR